MRNVDQVSSIKSELLELFMNLQENEHQQRKRSAAVRYLRARRGIELHNEFKRLEHQLATLEDERFS
ncbi:PA3496 family putative envelope integrity protein [Litchfieldella xinjiangensis]|uniref:PA3496 family putative envelope integrity protein n=1 Tax=Litchfieldella xinjiangensis TaxID=1166948 RepID=UPI0005B9F75B|nr:hypothetical protein [Halomonas xinjiangensis]